MHTVVSARSISIVIILRIGKAVEQIEKIWKMESCESMFARASMEGPS